MEKQFKILSIGAHPDDGDTSPAGLLSKLKDAGWEVRILSVTDGSSGHYDPAIGPEELKLTRRHEAFKSGQLFGARYDVLDYPDGRLEVTLEAREHLIRYIRKYNPDIIVTNRPNDYHADHRNTSLLIQDCMYLLAVPYLCPDTPALKKSPVVLFWSDRFQHPYQHQPDLIVPLSEEHAEMKVRTADCHASQWYGWLNWPFDLAFNDLPVDERYQQLKKRLYGLLIDPLMEKCADRLKEIYGKDAEKIKYIEAYEISEYGSNTGMMALPEEFIKIATSLE